MVSITFFQKEYIKNTRKNKQTIEPPRQYSMSSGETKMLKRLNWKSLCTGDLCISGHYSKRIIIQKGIQRIFQKFLCKS